MPLAINTNFPCMLRCLDLLHHDSKASSEHSISVALPDGQAMDAQEAAQDAFFRELGSGEVLNVQVRSGVGIVAAVGDKMGDTPGVAGLFFSALASAGVSVVAISQGTSQRNISALIESSQSTRSLRALHAAFSLSLRVLSGACNSRPLIAFVPYCSRFATSCYFITSVVPPLDRVLFHGCLCTSFFLSSFLPSFYITS